MTKPLKQDVHRREKWVFVLNASDYFRNWGFFLSSFKVLFKASRYREMLGNIFYLPYVTIGMKKIIILVSFTKAQERKERKK